MRKPFICLLFLLVLVSGCIRQFAGAGQEQQPEEPTRTITIETEKTQVNSTNTTPMFAPNIRWGEMPVRVWINEESGKGISYWSDGTVPIIKSAFGEWEDASDGLLRFEFVPSEEDAQIIVNFSSTNLSIADSGDTEKLGYGGPVWRGLGKFNIIESGFVIIVLQSMPCVTRDTAVHEIGHALGFEHSNMPGSVMYMYATCTQVIDRPLVDMLQSLYSVPALPDLVISRGELKVAQNSFNVMLNVTNVGLSTGGNVTVAFFDDADGKELYRTNSAPLPPGYYLTLNYVHIQKPGSGRLRIVVDPDNTINELAEDNNAVTVDLK